MPWNAIPFSEKCGNARFFLGGAGSGDESEISIGDGRDCLLWLLSLSQRMYMHEIFKGDGEIRSRRHVFRPIGALVLLASLHA